MTRETRIALLVGLAFIVLFAMVLSQRSLSFAPHSSAAASGAPAVPTPTVSPEVAMGRATEDYEEPSALAPGRLLLPGSHGGAATGAGASGGTVIVAEGPRPPTTTSRPTTSTRPSAAGCAVIAGSKPHTIAAGETLAKIAKAEYGSDKDWERIFEANKDKLKSPTAMKIGVVLMIPPGKDHDVTVVPSGSGTTGTSGGTVIVAEGPRPPTTTSRPTTSTRPSAAGCAVIAGSKPHTIAAGETLAKIAKAEYGSDKDWERIFEANKDKLKSPTAMKIGVVLMIPPGKDHDVTVVPSGSGTTGTAGGAGTSGSGTLALPPLPERAHPAPESTADLTAGKTYVVKQGDSLALIAKRVMGDGPTAVKKLAELNCIDDPLRLQVGQTLRIPS